MNSAVCSGVAPLRVSPLALRTIVTTGVALMSYLRISGSSASSGNSSRMRSIFSRTSVAATSTSRSSSNSMSTCVKLFKQVEVMCLMPSTCEMASSIFRVMEVSISSGEAPE